MKWLFVGAGLWLDRLQVLFGEFWMMRTIQIVKRAFDLDLPLFCRNGSDDVDDHGVTVKKKNR